MIDMTNDDIVERLRALSRCEHSDLSIGDEAAAEIVRLRGEVAERADDLTTAYMAGRFDAKAPAPAEAKGDACNCPGGYKRDPEKHAPNCPVRTLPCRTLANPFDTPQPAGGEAVAEVVKGEDDEFPCIQFTPEFVARWAASDALVGTKLYTHPAADALGAVRELAGKWREATGHDDFGCNEIRARDMAVENCAVEQKIMEIAEGGDDGR